MPGGAAPKGGGSTQFKEKNCKELKKKNEEERQKYIDKKKETGRQSRELTKASTGGMTYSSAQSTCGGGASAMTQSSSGLANEQITEDLKGGTSAQKMGLSEEIRNNPGNDTKKKAAGTLCNGSYVHPGGGYGAHAEAKIFNNLSNQQGGGSMQGCSVLLNIDWRRNTPDGGVSPSGMPCSTCHAMLCHAAKKCGVEIFICDKKGKPTKLSEQEDCDEFDGYEKLCERVDGGSTPGRLPG